MCRKLPAFFLVLLLVGAQQAHSQTANAPTPLPTPTNTAQVRAAAQRLLATGSAEDAVAAAGLLEKASEIDAHDAEALKAQAETQKLKQSPEPESGWKVLVDITPFLSFVIVALGFFFNSYQARAADKEKREEAVRQQKADEEKAIRDQAADEERRWTNALTLIQRTEDFSPAAAILSSFLTGAHAARARATAASVMLTAKRFANFSDLFNTFFEPVTPDKLNPLIALLRSVSITVAPLLSKSWENGTNNLQLLTAAEIDSYQLLTQERTFLGAKAAAALRQPRQSQEPIDLSDIGLDEVDLSGADLRGSIAPSTWNRVNLDDTDLRGMRSVERTWVYNSAWWHASHVDAPFLNLLIERSPYKADQWSNTPRGISAEGYRVNVERLRALASQAPVA